jgi:hypothetical protein
MLARDRPSHLGQPKEQTQEQSVERTPDQPGDLTLSTPWLWRIGCVTAAILIARQVLWIFYYRPLLGDATALDRWFSARKCLVAAWCGPRSLPFHHLGVLMLLAVVVLFGLAVWRWPGIWASAPTAPARSSSTQSRLTRFAVTLLTIAAAEAVGYQAYLWLFTEETPPTWLWASGIVAALLAAILWDMDDAADLARTAADLSVAAGIVLAALGAGAAMAGRGDTALLMLPGGLLFVGGSLWSRRAGSSLQPLDHMLMLGLTLAMLALAMSRAWSWRFAFIGDEWGFYTMANLLLDHPERLADLFSTHDTNHYHTIFSSALQAGVLWLTHANVFGWRLSSVLPVVLSLPGVYVLGYWLAGRSAAWLAAALFAGAHVLLMFSMAGYNNTQALAVLVTAPALFVFARRSSGILRLVLAGMTLGIGFAVFGLARLTVLPMAALIVLDGWPSLRRIVRTGSLIAASALATAAPMMFNLENWLGLLKATPVQSEVVGRFTLVEQMGRNAIAGALLFIASIAGEGTHFLAGAHADPATALLLLAGMGAVVFNMRHVRVARSWFFASVLAWLAVSAIQQYDWIANTRMFILPPIYAIYAGVGGTALAHLLVPHSPRLRALLLVMLAAAGIFLNQWHITHVSMVLGRDAWSIFGLVVQQFQATVDQEGVDGKSGLPIFVIQPAPPHSPLNRLIAAYEAKPERMVLLQPGELLQNEQVCAAADEPAMLLIPAQDEQLEEVRSRIRTCWPGAVETVIADNKDYPLLVRFITASTAPPETP